MAEARRGGRTGNDPAGNASGPGATPAGAGRRILVVFYSQSGYTRRVAERVAEQLGAKLVEIGCDRYGGKGLGRLRAAFDSLLGRQPPISVSPVVREDHDLVVVGAPVWTGHAATPVRSLLAGSLKPPPKAAFFITNMGSPPDKVFGEMAADLKAKPVATLCLRDKEIDRDEATAPIALFVAELRQIQSA